MLKTLRAVKFLFVGPMILVVLFAVNWMTSPGDWWVQWAALGIGIAWVISLFRVLWALAVAGGLAALWVHLRKGWAGDRVTRPGRAREVHLLQSEGSSGSACRRVGPATG